MEGVTSNIEDVNETSKKVSISIPADHFDKEFRAAIDRLSKTAQLKGFRPGKAPRSMIESLHGPRVRGEVTERLVASSLSKILKDNQLDVVGTPKIDLTSKGESTAIEFTATFDFFPRPTVAQYDSFTVRVPKTEPTDQDVDQVVNRIRESKSTLKKLELRTNAKKGDVLETQVSVQIESNEPSRPEPLTFELGEGRLPETVEQGLEGIGVTETRELKAAIPDDYRDPAMRGKEATFKVTLLALSEKVLPELTDELAKSLEFGADTVLDLRMKVRDSLVKEAEARARSEAESAILEELLKRNPFAVPQSLIDDEIRSLLARSGMMPPKAGDLSGMNVEPFREGLGEAALKRVRSAIAVDRIAESENLRASEDDVNQRVNELATETSLSLDEVRKYLAEGDRMLGLMLDITRTKVLQFLVSRAQIEYYQPEPDKTDKAS